MIRGTIARSAPAALAILLIAGAVATGGPAPPPGVVRQGESTLRALLGRADVVAAGRVAATDLLDDDGLAVHQLRVEELLRGEPGAEILPVVEIRGGTRRPMVVADAERVVALLRPAPKLSYLEATLPPGEHWETVGGRSGVIPIRSEADLDATRSLLDAALEAAALPPGDEQRAALRAFAFAELETGNPRWVSDGLLELRALPPETDLTTEEVSTLAGTLRDTALPAPIRVRLLDLLAERHWRGAKDVVAATEVDHPAVLDALLQARVRLGMPAGREELAPHLASDDPRLRAAAVKALAASGDPDAIAEVGERAVGDPDVEVQKAAIGALAGTGSDAAIPFVKETFGSDEAAVRQASAQALLALGGQRSTDALLDLALQGASPEARHYAAIILMLAVAPDDPAVDRLRAKSTDDAVQRLLEHGLELKVHRHD